jgi:hypothetical protein
MNERERQIFEASPAELEELLLTLEPATEGERYARVLLAYMRGRNEELEALAAEMQGATRELALWRLALRRRDERPNAPAFNATSFLWKGEFHFVRAMHHETFGREEAARADYYEAQRLFAEAGARRKSVKAYHNAIAAESRMYPTRRLIPEYQQAARWSIEAGDFTTAGAALNNLSREFQLMGAHLYALKVAQEAVEMLRAHAYATYQFYLSLCHLCQLHLQQGHHKAALLDYQEAVVANFPEVRSALEVLEGQLRAVGLVPGLAPPEAPLEARPKTWTERLEANSNQAALSAMESRLVEILAGGARDRHALIRELWGDQGDYFDLENRLKQLLHRVRKKRSDLLGYADGRYFLLDGWKAS